jgi:hypothetical protein
MRLLGCFSPAPPWAPQTAWNGLPRRECFVTIGCVSKTNVAAAARRAAARARAAELRDQADEELAPAAQRRAVVGAGGTVVRAPRLERGADGRSFVRSNPLHHLWARSQKRVDNDRVPLISDAHLRAAERLQRTVERTAEVVGLFRSSVTLEPVGTRTGATIVDPLRTVRLLNGQLAERVEWLAARKFLGDELWRPIARIVLDGVDVAVFAAEMDWREPLALGYLIAGLDQLVRFYTAIEPERRKSGFRTAEMVLPAVAICAHCGGRGAAGQAMACLSAT